MNTSTTIIPSPVGLLHAFANAEGVCAILWPGLDPARYGLAKEGVVRGGPGREFLEQLGDELHAYFEGRCTAFDVAVAPAGTEFQRAAWTALRGIPYGTTRTYAEQARVIGRPRAVRAVGAANGRNPVSIVIPCHRVVGSDGRLTGFAGGLAAKRHLLDLEARTLARRGSSAPVRGPGN